jgi:uncharacterized protein (TIGR02246 family)
VSAQSDMHDDAQPTDGNDEVAVRVLYREWLERWNKRNAGAYAALFAEDGNIVGFDGSPENGRAEIASHIGQIFADHQTARYIGIIREVRFLAPGIALVRAVAGMVPPGKSDLNPAVNAIQTLVAVKQHGTWRIALAQATPAQFHGRPELSEALTTELRQLP